MPYCSTCNVSCPSDYQLNQHLSGRKHAEVLKFGKPSGITGVCFQYQNSGTCWKGDQCTYKHIAANDSPKTQVMSESTTKVARCGPAPTGICYLWWKNGICSKGPMCTYKHELSSSSIPAHSSTLYSPTTHFDDHIKAGNVISPPQEDGKRLRDETGSISAEFSLCKTDDPDKANMGKQIDTQYPRTLAPLFCKPVESESKNKKSNRFTDECLNLFNRKRDVNLFIQNGLVVWEFAYDTKIIKAIKENIKGRAWNPSIGIKGCWTSPLESLPDAISLYEHMGRSASTELKRRSKEIQEKFGNSSASDAIKMVVRIYSSKSEGVDNVDAVPMLGSVDVMFLYDADTVSALKMLSPTQRTYNPVTKTWSIDILALPDLLAILIPLGYSASKRLTDLSSLTSNIDNMLFGQDEVSHNKSEEVKSLDTKLDTKSDKERTTCSAEDIIIIDDDEESSGADDIIIIDDDEETSGAEEIIIIDDDEEICGNDPILKAKKEDELEALIISMARLVAQKDTKSQSMNMTDCGSAKRQKLSDAQKKWSSKFHLDSDIDDGNSFSDVDDDDNSFGSLPDGNSYTSNVLTSWTTNIYQSLHRAERREGPVKCDCGKPFKLSGGTHTCRYFGTFQCLCGNCWTSAYCWKGEMQACRSCNCESLPVKKEQLDGRIGRSTSAHDTMRCGRCRTLGYNCSGAFG
jgi:hypothetical protein